ncbi:MAG: InlB B-repeat-containing protein [Clostridia bacterium]|nr:InlB B-repeat-containing protein [Clostridia bacterium]
MMKKCIRLLALLLSVVFVFSSCSAGLQKAAQSGNLDTDVKETINGIINSAVKGDNQTNVEDECFDIIYHLDGGINSPQNPHQYLENSHFSLEAPSKRAHEFLGWATAENGEVKYEAGVTYDFEGDLNLYARWKYAPTNEEHLELFNRGDIPESVLLSVQEKIAFDYQVLGFETYETVVGGCYAVCYFYPEMVEEGNIIPCGIVLLNFPVNATVPTGIEVECEYENEKYTLVSAFESEDLGQYQYREKDGTFILYDVEGPYVYIEWYNTAQEVDDAISLGTSSWDLDLYSWCYQTSDFLTIPFDFIPDYDSTYDWQLFGDYTVSKMIEEIQSLEIAKNATSIETFTGVFLSEDLAKYVESCLINGSEILINGVPFSEVAKMATEELQAGRLVVINLDGTIGVCDFLEGWTCEDDLKLAEEQAAQLGRQLILMGATIVVGVCLAPYTAGASLAGAIAIGTAFGFAGELLQQIYVEGRDWGELDWGSIGLQAGLGALTAGISVGVCKWVEKVATHSVKMARALPFIAGGLDLTLDVGATVAYDLAMGYDANLIAQDVAMTVLMNGVISMITSACFTAGTQIATPQGSKNIEDIKLDDLVYSYSDGKVVVGKVTQLYCRQAIVWSVALTNGQIIKTTAYHPFYVNGEYIEVKDLQKGDELLLLDGTAAYVDFVKQEALRSTVYNFSVDEFHNYFADGVLVHNSCGPKVQELIDTGYQNVKYKDNYHPVNAEQMTDVYLILVKEDGLDKMVSGRILEIYPDLNGKTYRQACIFVDGQYILKVGTTANSVAQRYSSVPQFLKDYGLDKLTDVSIDVIATAPNKDALMIESQILKNLSLDNGKPFPGNSNYTEYKRSTMYNYKIDSANPNIDWYVDNFWEVYVGYGD